MLKKYLLFLIIFTIAISMVMNTMATQYYVTLNITTFESAPIDGSAATTMKIVQGSNSAVNLTIWNSTYKLEYNETRTESREYGANDQITVGPIPLVSGQDYYFNISFDEVLFGSNYYGSCNAVDRQNFTVCRNCRGFNVTCLSSGGGNVFGTNGYAPYHSSAGSTGNCDGTITDAACSAEIARVLNVTETESFSLNFTAP